MTKTHYYYLLLRMGLRVLFKEGLRSLWSKFRRWRKLQASLREIGGGRSGSRQQGNGNPPGGRTPDISALIIGEQSKRSKQFTFVSYYDLIAWTTDWIRALDQTYDVIVGIPRSGLLVASLIALSLGKPLSTPKLLVQNAYWLSDKIARKPTKVQRVLLVDDSVSSGEAILEELSFLRKETDFEVTPAALIATGEARHIVDLTYKVILPPYNFEWCLIHQKGNGIDKIAMDLDGVISEDCPSYADLDDVLYVKWLKSAKAIYVPTFTIDVIVSNRLEKYRSPTEEWLAQNGVRYKRLYLWDLKSKEERGDISQWIEHKAQVVRAEKAALMYESDREQAEGICRATGIPTLCFQNKELFQ